MWREQLTTLRTSTVGSCQPVGLITCYTKERALVHQSEVAGSRGLKLTKEDVGIRSTTRYERTNRTNQRSEEREGSTSQQHETLGDIVGHTRIVHQHGHSHEAANGYHRLLQVECGLSQQFHQFAEAHTLNQTTNHSTQENHQSCIRQPTKLEGITNHWQVELSHQRLVQSLIHWRHNLAGDENEEDNQTIYTPSLEGLGESEILVLHLYGISGTLLLDEEFVVDEHGDDGCYRTQNSRCLRTNPVGAAELNHDRECAYKESNGDILQDLRAVGHHEDEERRDEEHQRELQNDECSHLTKLLGCSYTTGSHLVSQRRGGQTYSTETYSHRIGYQTDHSREHRLETQSDQDGSRDSHSRSETSHTFEHTAKTPC